MWLPSKQSRDEIKQSFKWTCQKKTTNLKFNGGVKYDNVAKFEDREHSTKLTMNRNQNLNKMSMNRKINNLREN